MHSHSPKFRFPDVKKRRVEMARPAPTQPLKLPALPFFIPAAILLRFSLLLGPANGQAQICNGQGGNFTSNETYGKTLDSLLGLITPTRSDILNYRLFNTSASQPWDSDDIQVLGVCSGDITGDACQVCLSEVTFYIRQHCPTNKQAAVFVEKCWIRYSNVQLYGVLKMDVSADQRYIEDASDEGYMAALLLLLGRLRRKAAAGGPVHKYATGIDTGESYTMYGMVQCSPDLSEQQCGTCLGEDTWSSGRGKVIGGLMMPSCRSRFETYPFFNSEVPLAPPSPPPIPTVRAVLGNHNSKTWTIVGAVIGSGVVIGILLLLMVRRKIRSESQSKKFINVDVGIPESLQFDLDIIRAATENFSEANKLGQGGFGSVFRGKLCRGQEIAVKRLSQNSGQGESEFENESRLLLQLQHRNLVRLLGYCLDGVERLLVYEFVPNASLDKFIFDPIKRKVLDWDTRYKIITGISRGLLYLHEDSSLRIVHRDLKASNILLDLDLNPKISDFGMARLFELNQTQANTNRIMGTFGYMAPEYATRGKFSVKSDVFSFGVLVLEIISGRRNLADVSGEEYEMLICQAWTNWRDGNITDIVDPAVSSGYSASILRCIHIGLLCVQEKAENRPEMISVIRWLDHHSITLPVPTQPAFFSGTSSSTRTVEVICSRNYAGASSINGASISELYPR